MKSIPIVEIKVGLNVLSANRNIIQVFPTPLSPIRRSLKNKSKFFAITVEMFVSLSLRYIAVSSDGVQRSGYQISVTREPETEMRYNAATFFELKTQKKTLPPRLNIPTRT